MINNKMLFAYSLKVLLQEKVKMTHNQSEILD